ncbi:MAG: Gfo/Idh/MocA family oxidoreductase [Lachnospiraceae bacterium]|nr:Gfo/Idh/MocA family oxidoreductase [Lachnospiraceae bacterium]
MRNIVLIGVGSMGKHHLQALLKLKNEFNIYALEINEETLQKLKDEFPCGVFFVNKLIELPTEIKLAIIATSSNERRSVFEQLLVHSEVENILFEKVLFQKEKDYYFVEKKLRDKKINAWVNCARREWEIYHEIKRKVEKCKYMIFTAIGGQWGLGCNGIHMLDLIQFLVNGGRCDISISGLDDRIVESKRKGFYEIFGTISGSCGKCRSFQLSCIDDTNLPFSIEISTDIFRIRIDELQQKKYISEKKNNWEWEQRKFELPYQSQLTNRVAKSIIERGTCSLTDYDTSMQLHLDYILPLMNFFTRQGMEKELCPIT